jgi:hypothetical protein
MISNKAKDLLKYLCTVGYADALNMAIMTVRKAKLLDSVDEEPKRLIRLLRANDLINPIRSRFELERPLKEIKHGLKRLYQPTKEAYDFSEIKYKHIPFKSVLYQEHNHMLVNVLTMFYRACYGRIEVEYKKFDNYEPDAVLRCQHQGKERTYFIEMETGTWHIGDFIKRIEKMKKFDTKGARFLIIRSHESFNPYWFPSALDNSVNLVEADRHFDKFLSKVQSHIDNRFIIFPYHKINNIQAIL